MTRWQTIPSERRMLYSPIGLRLVDDFTGFAPFGKVRANLDVRDADGEWRETEIHAIRTLSDVLAYPGLGRSANVAAPPVRYRARIDASFYQPDYLLNVDGLEFDVHPYDDDTPPAVAADLPVNLFLMPASNYPFPAHIRVLRGRVVATNGAPVANVEVTESARERVLTDARGSFALPLRWPGVDAVVQVDALDHRSGRSAQVAVTLPAGLAVGHVVTIN